MIQRTVPPEEKAFAEQINRNYRDHFDLGVFADWLEDRNDPRTDGYRFIIAERLLPWRVDAPAASWWNADRLEVRYGEDDRVLGEIPYELWRKLVGWSYVSLSGRNYTSCSAAYAALAAAYVSLANDERALVVRKMGGSSRFYK